MRRQWIGALVLVGMMVVVIPQGIGSSGATIHYHPAVDGATHVSGGFSFPYSYGTPTIPSTIGAEGLQGLTVPLSSIGNQNPTPGPTGIVGPVNSPYNPNLPGTSATLSLTVKNGTTSSSVVAVSQQVAAVNVTTGLWVHGVTSVSGTVSLAVTAGWWGIEVNASNPADFISFDTYSAIHVASPTTSMTIYLLPTSEGVANVGNGPPATMTLSIWVTSGLGPQDVIYIENHSAGGGPGGTGARMTYCVTLSNRSCEFTNVNTAYTYDFYRLGYSNLQSGFAQYIANVSIGIETYSNGQTHSTLEFGSTSDINGWWSSTASVTGSSFPSGNNTGFSDNAPSYWSLGANTIVTGGISHVSSSIVLNGHSLTFDNGTVFFNSTIHGGDVYTGHIHFNNETVYFEMPPWTYSYPSNALVQLNTGPGGYDVFDAVHSNLYLGQEGDSNVVPHVNNSNIAFANVQDGEGLTEGQPSYANDVFINASWGDVPNLTRSDVFNSTLVSNYWTHLPIQLTDDYVINSTIEPGNQGVAIEHVTVSNCTIVNPQGFLVNYRNGPIPAASSGSVTYTTFESAPEPRDSHWYILHPETMVLSVTNVSYSSFLFSTVGLGASNATLQYGQNTSVYDDYINNTYTEAQIEANWPTNYQYADWVNYYPRHLWALYGFYNANDTVKNSLIDAESYGTFSPGYLDGNNIHISHVLWDGMLAEIQLFQANRGVTITGFKLDNSTFTGQYWSGSLNSFIPCYVYTSGCNTPYGVATIADLGPLYGTVSHVSFMSWMPGNGAPADFGLNYGNVTIEDCLFEPFQLSGPNGGVNTPSAAHQAQPWSEYIATETQMNLTVKDNWFLGLNDYVRPFFFQTGSRYVILDDNRYFISPAPLQPYVTVSLDTANASIGGYYFLAKGNVEPPHISEDMLPVFNTTETLLCHQSQTGGCDFSAIAYAFAPDVNISTNIATVGYQNGLVGGPQPNFLWHGYNYSEQVEPGIVELGVNSSRAPVVSIVLSGLTPGKSYTSYRYTPSGSLLSQSSPMTANATGAITDTYNPATMPDPTVFFVNNSSSAFVLPPAPVRVLSYTNTTVTLNWSDRNQTVTNVTVWWGKTLTTMASHAIGYNTTQWTIQGLSPKTFYTFQVELWDQTIHSLLSVPVNVTTGTSPSNAVGSFLPVEPNMVSGSTRSAILNATGSNEIGQVYTMTGTQTGTSLTTLTFVTQLWTPCQWYFGGHPISGSNCSVAHAPPIDLILSSTTGSWANPHPSYTIVSAKTYVNTTRLLSTTPGPPSVTLSPTSLTTTFFCGVSTGSVSTNSAANLVFTSACPSIGLDPWSNGHGVSGLIETSTSGLVTSETAATPIFTVTRVITYAYSASQPLTITKILTSTEPWQAIGPNVVGSFTLDSVNNSSYPNKAWTTIGVAICLPANNTYVTAQSTLYWINGTTYTRNWTITNGYFVANWGDFPVGYSQSFTVTMNVVGGRPSLDPGCRTGSGGPPGAATPPSTISLVIGNVTQESNGSEIGYAVWTNNYTLPFNGTIIAGSSLLINAQVQEVVIGATPLITTGYVVSSGFVNVIPGYGSVDPGQTIRVTVLFLPTSPYSPHSTIAIIDGYVLQAPTLIMLASLAAVGIDFDYRRRVVFKDWISIFLSFGFFAAIFAVAVT